MRTCSVSSASTLTSCLGRIAISILKGILGASQVKTCFMFTRCKYISNIFQTYQHTSPMFQSYVIYTALTEQVTRCLMVWLMVARCCLHFDSIGPTFTLTICIERGSLPPHIPKTGELTPVELTSTCFLYVYPSNHPSMSVF